MGSRPTNQRLEEKRYKDIDSVSFFEILEVIFGSKRLILLTTFLFSGLGLGLCAFLAYQVSFLSKVEVMVESTLQDSTERKISQSWVNIFEKDFYDPTVFDKWQNEAKNTAINFEEINVYTTIDGYRFYDPSRSLVKVLIKGEKNVVLDILSGEPAKVSAIFDYTKLVARNVEATVVAELNAAVSVVKESADYIDNPDDDSLAVIQIQLIELGQLIGFWQQDAISLTAPTRPVAAPRPYATIFIISTISGFVLACFLALLIDAKRRFDRSMS